MAGLHQTRPDSIWAAGSVSAAGAQIAPPVAGTGMGTSDWTVALVGSTFTITLGSPIDVTERVVIVTVRDILDSIATVTAGTDTTIQVDTGTANTGAGAAKAFDFVCIRVAG